MAFEVQQTLLWWQILNGRWIRAGWKQPDLSFDRKQSSLCTLEVSRQISQCLSVCGADESVLCSIFLLGLSSCQSLIKIIWIKAQGDDIAFLEDTGCYSKLCDPSKKHQILYRPTHRPIAIIASEWTDRTMCLVLGAGLVLNSLNF